MSKEMSGDIQLSDVFFEIMSLKQEGYCCSQIVMKLALRELDRDNPGLVRAVAGLCYGAGSPEGTCGVLTGANCALALGCGDSKTELPPENLELRRSELTTWFREKAKADYGGTSCGEILAASPKKRACAQLLAATVERLRGLLAENGGRKP